MVSRILRSANIHYSPGRFKFAPQWMVLGVNNVCNLHCKMCDVGTGNTETNFSQNLIGARPIHMPLELFRDIADQTVKYYPNAKLGYAFTEPLVYKYLHESLSYANEKGLFTSITTNALTLKQKADGLIDGGLNDLYISLDGLQETHNEIRGNKKSFQKALEGIEYLLDKENAPKISIFCVITEWNFQELKAFVDYFKPYNIEHIGFMHTNFVNPDLAKEHNEKFGEFYYATPSNVDEVSFQNYNLKVLNEQINAILADDYPFKISFTPHLTNELQLHGYYHNHGDKIGKLCEDLFSNIMIKSDGSCIPAHGRCYQVQMGNLYKQNLKEIWTGEPISNMRKTVMKEGGMLPACTRCCSAF